ncbi:hypothetical protein CWI39_2047p0010 [Hamiltosporidium magnivora]|uniref:BHLH domain-containing protein n=1 Tax=Hamiltosporidium magnivora TaxID=148818 RepID=A0A4Q9KWS6_9MICR|nr:hypothetical protein CWI39_2047p0010 [Hamiltosporidium magnivora]
MKNKESHKFNEKKRRSRQKNCINVLRFLIPNLSHRRSSTLTVLEEAIKYIKYLEFYSGINNSDLKFPRKVDLDDYKSYETNEESKKKDLMKITTNILQEQPYLFRNKKILLSQSKFLQEKNNKQVDFVSENKIKIQSFENKDDLMRKFDYPKNIASPTNFMLPESTFCNFETENRFKIYKTDKNESMNLKNIKYYSSESKQGEEKETIYHTNWKEAQNKNDENNLLTLNSTKKIPICLICDDLITEVCFICSSCNKNFHNRCIKNLKSFKNEKCIFCSR